jgi:uncharacterized protein
MYFALLYRFNPDAGHADAQQQEIFSNHLRYIKRLFAGNRVVMSGAYTEVNGGLVILEANSREEAEAIAAGDPALSSSLYLGELHEWQVLFNRG